MPAKRDESTGESAAAGTATVLDRMLGAGESPRPGVFAEAEVVTWSETCGTLGDGRLARLGESCLLRPGAGDRVLVWSGANGERWVISVLERVERSGQENRMVVASPHALTIQAPRIALTAEAVHIQAGDFLSSTRNRHAVEQVRTETVRTRVAQIGTDIRRAGHATDEVDGTVLQRAGTWISNTLREARLHAKAFLFD